MAQFSKIFRLSLKSFAIYALRKIKFYQNSLNGFEWVLSLQKEKAELLKIIFSKKNAFSELLATEKPKYTKYPPPKVFCRHRNN